MQQGWVVVFTDGSTKRVRGWMQAGYGVWYESSSSQKCCRHVLAQERQSVSSAELRNVLHAFVH